MAQLLAHVTALGSDKNQAAGAEPPRVRLGRCWAAVPLAERSAGGFLYLVIH